MRQPKTEKNGPTGAATQKPRKTDPPVRQPKNQEKRTHRRGNPKTDSSHDIEKNVKGAEPGWDGRGQARPGQAQPLGCSQAMPQAGPGQDGLGRARPGLARAKPAS